MGVRSPSLSALVGKLDDKGYITRVKDETDRRNLNISITQQGELALAEMQKEHEKILDELFTALDGEERREASRLLQKLLDAWEPRHRELKKAFDARKAKQSKLAERAEQAGDK